MEKNKLMMGWSRCDITPQRPVYLLGQFYDRLSTHVRDPLTATACAIEGDGCQLILVSCDLAEVSGDLLSDIRTAVIRENPKIKADNILISAIHTHTGPIYSKPADAAAKEKSSVDLLSGGAKFDFKGDVMTPEEVYAMFVSRISEAILKAAANKKPVGISTQLEYCTVGFNRIMLYKDGSSRMYGNPETADFEGVLGASDPGVEMMYAFNEDGTLSGIIIEVACPSQIVEHHSFISADYWAETRKLLRDRFGDIGILPLCGSAGDQSPRDLVRMKRESSLRSGESPLNSHMPEADITTPGWEMYDERGLFVIAKRLERAVCDGYARAKDDISWDITVSHVSKDLCLPMMRVSLDAYLDSYKKCVAILEKSGLDPNAPWISEKTPSLVREELFEPYGIVARYEAQQKTDLMRVETHIFRIGETAFFTTPFELYVEYAFRVRARAKFNHLISIQLCCGSLGYLPVKRAHVGRSYSAIAASSTVGPEGGTLLSAILADELNSMR
jgi:hypothetical protein